MATHAQTTVEIEASRDNTLYEDTDGSLSNGAGFGLFAGRTARGELRRALIGFDDLAAIPAGAQISSVELELRVNRNRSPALPFFVHEVLADWGEGDSVAPGQQGSGGAAAPGDATWIHRFFDDQLWDNPGGDFSPNPVSQTNVDNNGTYRFPSSPEFVSLVQAWVDDPSGNFGLMILADEAMSGSSAKRFSSREGASPPTLRVTFTEGGAGPSFAINQGITGAWFDMQTPGQGFLMEVEPEESFIFVAWFTFEAAAGKVGAPEHRWLTAQGNFSGDSAENLTLSVTSGGVFDAADMTTTETAGALTLTFTSCTEGTVDYVLDEGLSGTIPITRVIPGTEALCETLAGGAR